MKNNKDLSIIILSYNTAELLVNCINSILENTKGVDYEIIVVDNASSDNSLESVSKLGKKDIIKIVKNNDNLGFAKGNNTAKDVASGKHILFLNSDTLVHENTLKKSLDYLKSSDNIGALSVKTVLPSGELDRDARRSFPTPWVAFTHFSGLDRIFPKSKLFARYWYGYKSAEIIQDVEVIQGAFFLTKRKILDNIGWFSEEYFLDGEDIDLSWKVKKEGYRIVYYPEVYITHVKKASKNKLKKRSTKAGVNSMEIFYKKYMWSNYPIILNWLVILGIRFVKLVRSSL